MADRSIVLRLRAEIADFQNAMRRAADAVRPVNSAAERLGSAATEAGRSLVLVGAAAAAGVGLAVTKFAEFDQQMSNVKAATHETTENMGLLREAALQAGADTAFSATEAAQAVEELAKAGVSTNDVLGGGLQGALDLAAAGTIEVGAAAETAASAMTQFGLSGAAVPHIADLLAAGAGKAQGTVADLGAALNQAGLIAAQTGLSIEETTGGLAAFASAGLVGSDAGTSFKTMLQALTPNSVAAATAMEKIGFSAYDAQGNFIGLEAVAGQLQAGLSGLTAEQRNSTLETIFGSDAVRAASVLYEQGAGGISKWVGAVDDAGFAAETAALKMDNLNGDLEYLKGSLDTALIQTGSSANEALRALVQALTSVIDAYNDFPAGVQGAVLVLGAVVAAVGLAVGGFLILAPQVYSTVVAFQALTAASATMSASLVAVAGVAGAALAGAAALVGLVLAAQGLASMSVYDADVDELADSLGSLGANGKLGAEGLELFQSRNVFGDIGPFGEEIKTTSQALEVFGKTAKSALGDDLDSVAGRIQQFNAPVGKFQEQVSQLDEALASLVEGGKADEAAAAYDQLIGSLDPSIVDEVKESFSGYNEAVANVPPATAGAATSFAGLEAPVEDAQAAIDGLSDAIDAILSQFFDVDEASDAFQSSLLDIAELADDNTRSLEDNTREGLANQEMLRNSVKAGADQIRAMAEQGATGEELASTIASLKQQFIDQATAAGFSREKIAELSAAFDAIPAAVTTQVSTLGVDDSLLKVQTLQTRLNQVNGLQVKASIRVDEVLGTTVARGSFAGRVTERADGGMIPLGLGGPREDNVPAWLSSGEFVVNAKAAQRNLPLLHSINAQRFADGGVVGRYANGGTVNSAQISTGLAAARTPVRVSDSRYARSLLAEAEAAAVAAQAEASLAAVRKGSEQDLKLMKEALDASVDAEEARRDAIEDAAEAEVDARKKAQRAEVDALKASQPRPAAGDDALRQQQDAAVKALESQHDAENEASEARITQLKKNNAAAVDLLTKATKEQIDLREDQNAAKVEEAEVRLTAAKDQAKAATDELTDAEQELADARRTALELAQSISDSLSKGAGLSSLLGDTSRADLDGAAKGLADVAAAAEKARGSVRGESKSAATSRRSGALEDLARQAAEFADAQEAFGVAPAEVQRGLDEQIAKIKELGQAYGLTSETISGVTDSLSGRGVTGGDILDSLQREAARTAEMATLLKQLTTAGLNAGTLDELASQGTGGLDAARALAQGGPQLISQINSVRQEITAVSDQVGAFVAAARYDPNFVQPVSVDGGTVALDNTTVLDIAGQIGKYISEHPTIINLDGAAIASNVASRQAAQQFAVAP